MRALRAAFYNPDRAVDYLLNGIPDNPEPQERPSAGGNMPSAPTGDMGDNPLAFLQNNPMFSQLRDRIIREPAFFQTFMNQLAQTQPQLHQAISQNPQQFLQLLLGGAGGGMGEAPDSDPPGTIRVTQEEKDAIERLTSLGFPKHRAIEAFFACDKNEEWAANYLFENGGNDDQYDQDVVQEESMADAQNSGIIPPEFEGDAFMPEDYPENPAASDDMALDNPVLDALQNNPPAQQDPPAEQDQPAEEAPADNAPANKDNGNNANNDNNDDEDGSCL